LFGYQSIGDEFQSQQMTLFPSVKPTAIPDAGHELFFENLEANVDVVRAYLNVPAKLTDEVAKAKNKQVSIISIFVFSIHRINPLINTIGV